MTRKQKAGRSRLRKAARLLYRGIITEVEYSAIAVGTVLELLGVRLKDDPSVSAYRFWGDALKALGLPTDTWPSQTELQLLGPLSGSVTTLQQSFPGWAPLESTTLFWSPVITELYRRSVRRLRLPVRIQERLGDWRAEQTEISPAIASDLLQWAVRIAIAVLAFVLGYWLRG